MHARISTFHFVMGDQEGADADTESALRLLTDQEGCRGAWQLVPDDSESITEAVFVSLWDTKEQAESAGDRARPGLQQLMERYQGTLTAPPEVRVLTVRAGFWAGSPA